MSAAADGDGPVPSRTPTVSGKAVLVCAAVALLPANSVATSADRIAVLIVPGAGVDASLADNLTEVAIAKFAEASRGEFVGMRELRRWFADDGARGQPADCVSRESCLKRMSASLGIRKAAIGDVAADQRGFTVAIRLQDVATGAVERRLSTRVDGAVPELIEAVQAAVAALLQPTGPRVSLEIRPLRAEPPDFSLGDTGRERLLGVKNPPEPRRWPTYAVFAGTSLAVLSFSAAALLGISASEPPVGRTRADTEQDLVRRESYATASNALWLLGAAATAASVALFVRSHLASSRD